MSESVIDLATFDGLKQAVGADYINETFGRTAEALKELCT
jgi:hypothetical protein